MTARTNATTRRTEEVQLPSTIDVRYGTVPSDQIHWIQTN